MTFFTESETRGIHFQKVYANTLGRMFKQAIEKIIGNVRMFLGYWADDEQVAKSIGKVTKTVILPSKEK